MSIQCNPCEGTGFKNLFQVPGADKMTNAQILQWIKDNPDSDVCVCDCCGDGEEWYGEPGQHYTAQDPIGRHGPYASNGGLCKCH